MSHHADSPERFEHVNWAGARFHDANLTEAGLTRVNLQRATVARSNLSGIVFLEVNLSDNSIPAIHMGGASLMHVQLPEGREGTHEPVRFEQCELQGARFQGCDLSRVEIRDCHTPGMTIDGVEVEELLRVYHESRRKDSS